MTEPERDAVIDKTVARAHEYFGAEAESGDPSGE
jgi:hypothetical protein